MPGWSLAPAGDPYGTVLVVPDIYGTTPFYAELTRRLANEGYAATLLDYFFREGKLEETTREAAFARRGLLDEPRALRDLSAAIDQLGGNLRTGVVGFCLAGQFALNLCAERSDIAAVCYYPFPEGVGEKIDNTAPLPINQVDRISGPILSFWGSEDPMIPTSVISRFETAIRDAGADYTQYVYDNVGHGFLQGMLEDRDDTAAANDSWSKTLAFLNKSLAETT